MFFDNSDSPPGAVFLLRLEQGPMAVSGARPFWIIGEAGLTVGRAPDCNISLSDPARLISRVQARVALIQGHVVWQQLGANPSLINASPLEKGAQKILQVNDVIRLDPYVLQVEMRSAPSTMTRTASVAAIPEDWNPMAQPELTIEASKILSQFSGEPPGSQLDQILQTHDASIPHKVNLPESKLLEEASSIDDLLGPGMRVENASSYGSATAPVWMDELHARHGFSVTGSESVGKGASASIPMSEPSGGEALAQAESFENGSLESHFLEGLGLKNWVLNQAHHVSPNFYFEMGCGYRKALDGLIAMMSARTLLKNQIHAEHTTLVPRDNNPLKSCPGVDDLFLRWFASSDHSYLKPEQSIEASIQDLLGQQRATLLALKMVITRLAEVFDPEALISKTEDSSAPWDFRKYKARWEAHVDAYHSIFGNAADPVSALLADTFREAFELQAASKQP